jgi:hypothetical protein
LQILSTNPYKMEIMLDKEEKIWLIVEINTEKLSSVVLLPDLHIFEEFTALLSAQPGNLYHSTNT